MKRIVGILSLILCLSMAAQAEIEKNAVMCDTGICLYWWPKLPQLRGWHQDEDASFGYQVNAVVPEGFTFANAQSVMYAKALFKPRIPETKSLDILIADDKKEFLAADPEITISETGTLTSADNKKLRSFTFFPKTKGNWEQVSYGEEGDFYLIFTVSAKSKQDFDKTQSAYLALVSRYKE